MSLIISLSFCLVKLLKVCLTVYLGVRSCEHFLCLAFLVFLGSVELISLFSLGLRSPVNFTDSYTKDSEVFFSVPFSFHLPLLYRAHCSEKL